MDQIVIGKIMLKCIFFFKILKMLLAFVELHATQNWYQNYQKRRKTKQNDTLQKVEWSLFAGE